MGKAVRDGLQSSCDRMAVESVAPYLVLLGDVLLVVLLHLPELGLQATELHLHLLHVLQVPLGSLVQHLDGLGHVLDLNAWGDTWGQHCDLRERTTSRISNGLNGATSVRWKKKMQQIFNMLLWLTSRSDSLTLTSGQLVRGLRHMVEV